jgi:hypothetical protein
MNKKVFGKITKYSISFIIVVNIFALVWFILPKTEIIFDPKNYLNCLYFSVITITTTGYGDLSPIGNIGKVVALLESIVGVVIISLILNSVWNIISDEIVSKNTEETKNEINRNNDARLRSYLNVFNIKLNELLENINLLTSKLQIRGYRSIDEINRFTFKDLVDMFYPALLTTHNFGGAIIHDFFRMEKEIIIEMKYIIGRFDLSRNTELEKLFIQYITLYENTRIEEAVEGVEITIKNNPTVKKTFFKMFESAAEDPKLEDYPSNIIQPIIILYYSLKDKVKVLQLIQNIHV